jgi:hypothetical protein
VDAYLYVKNYTLEKSFYKVKFEIKEMEELGKNIGLISKQ